MKYNFNNLYLGYCRHTLCEGYGKDVPDYEYYYGLFLFDGFKIKNINDSNTLYKFVSNVHNEDDEISYDIVYAFEPLSHFIDYKNKTINSANLKNYTSTMLEEKNKIKKYGFKRKN